MIIMMMMVMIMMMMLLGIECGKRMDCVSHPSYDTPVKRLGYTYIIRQKLCRYVEKKTKTLQQLTLEELDFTKKNVVFN